MILISGLDLDSVKVNQHAKYWGHKWSSSDTQPTNCCTWVTNAIGKEVEN